MWVEKLLELLGITHTHGVEDKHEHGEKHNHDKNKDASVGVKDSLSNGELQQLKKSSKVQN